MSLAGLCRWAGQFESHLIGNPEARFSRDEDQIIEMRMKAQEPRATIVTVQWYQKKTGNDMHYKRNDWTK